VAVSDGVMSAVVAVGDGVSVLTEAGVGVKSPVVNVEVDVAIIVGMRMMGVGLTMPGVLEGIGVQTGSG